VARLGDPDMVRRPLLRRLRIEVCKLDPAVDVVTGRAKGWKEGIGKSFQDCVKALFGTLRQRPKALQGLVRHGPDALLECFVRASVGGQKFVLEEGKVRDLLQKMPVAPLEAVVKREKSKSNKPPDGFCFLPKVPEVKTVFETKLPIGMLFVSRTVASEIIVSTSRQVLEPGNLEKMGVSAELVASKVPQQVVCAALLAAFERQRLYFGTGVEGNRVAFVSGLERMFKREADGSYRLLDHGACVDKEISKAFLLSLFIGVCLLHLTVGKCVLELTGKACT